MFGIPRAGSSSFNQAYILKNRGMEVAFVKSRSLIAECWKLSYSPSATSATHPTVVEDGGRGHVREESTSKFAAPGEGRVCAAMGKTKRSRNNCIVLYNDWKPE
jgi:hypothetical protein